MSLAKFVLLVITPCFPRVSGDEPLTPNRALAGSVFSPRERG